MQNYNVKKKITITMVITFVLKHLQNESKTHFHGVMKAYFQKNIQYGSMQ